MTMRNSSDFLVNHGMSSLTSFSGLFSGALRSTDTTVPYKDISTCHDAKVSPRVTACHCVLCHACIVCLATFSFYFQTRGVCYFRSVVVFVYSNNCELTSRSGFRRQIVNSKSRWPQLVSIATDYTTTRVDYGIRSYYGALLYNSYVHLTRKTFGVK